MRLALRTSLVFLLGILPSRMLGCALARATPATCLTFEWVRTLAQMQRTEDNVAKGVKELDDPIAGGFYAIKSRLRTETLLQSQIAPYQRLGDARTTLAAGYAMRVLRWLYSNDSSGQVDLRRVAEMKASVAEMQEKQAEIKVRSEQLLKVLLATSGAVLEATLVFEGDKPVTKRRMTLLERDAIVAELDKTFKKYQAADLDGHWHSAWAATASVIRSSLIDQRWQYSSQPAP